LPQRVKVFSRLISDLHFFVDLEQFKGIQLQYVGDEELRAANRKIQAEIKGNWQKKQNKKSSMPNFRLP
jgi:predicted nuclease of restriction endonuclease-like RecB superfamily